MDQPIAVPPSASWRADLDELAERKRIAREMGGAERIARQPAGGRLREFATMAAPPRTRGQSLFTMRP
jgi:hypothetical protein